MKLPNFFVAGAIKSGTGALHQYLTRHPQIFMSELKEPRFFVRNIKNNHEEGGTLSNSPRTLQEYALHFSNATEEKVIGESSSNYMCSEKAAKNIKQLIPDAKFLFTLRKPSSRSIAHYKMVHKKSPNITDLSDNSQDSWITASLYFQHLSKFLEYFPRDNIKIIIMEEWSKEPSSSLESIYSFLGVDAEFSIPPNIIFHPAVVAWPSVWRKTRLRKVKKYLPDSFLMKLNKLKLKYTKTTINSTSIELNHALNSYFSSDRVLLEKYLGRQISVWDD